MIGPLALVVAGLAAAAVLGAGSFLPAPAAMVASLALYWVLPGYALTEALLGGGHARMNRAERAVLAVPVSLALMAFIGVTADALGARLTASLFIPTATAVVVLSATIAIVRRAPSARLAADRHQRLPEGTLASLAAVGVALAGAVVIFAVGQPPAADRYTELALLDAGGAAPGLRTLAIAGEEQRYVALIRNADAPATYTLRITGPDEAEPRVTRFALDYGQETSVVVRVVWDQPGTRFLRIELDRDQSRGYRSVAIEVEVRSEPVP